MTRLSIAVRAFTEDNKKRGSRKKEPMRPQAGWPRDVLIFDTETTTDESQRLTFGCWRHAQWSEDGTRLETLEEGFFYADDLPETDPVGYSCLQHFVKTHRADVVSRVPDQLQLIARSQFVEEAIWGLGYNGRALIVGFNLPFDLSRIAVECGAARGQYRGGFSLVLWQYRKHENEPWRPNPYRPRIRIKHIDSKKSFIEFDRPMGRDEDNLRPGDGEPPNPGFGFKGHFLDLKTLACALTSEGYTLASACDAFAVENSKAHVLEHGVITAKYVEYNRRDVRASLELLEKLRVDFDRHPVQLDPCKAYSPASLAKAYFRAMGLTPPAEKFEKLPSKILGHAMSAFYGGRAEVRVRKTMAPVVYTDFLSMYPTVQTIMGLWDLLSAQRLAVVDTTQEVQGLLDQVTVEDIFRPEFWLGLRGFAQLQPDGDILPCRAKYNGNEWTVGVNYLTSESPLWYAIPDLVASKLLSGKTPKIRKAYRLAPRRTQRGLRPVAFCGGVEIDPRKENLFKTVIEERKRTQADRSLGERDRDRIQLALKIFANAGSFGVFVEMNQDSLPEGESRIVSMLGREGQFECAVKSPEKPGPYSFPPVAALITSGARLMLAALERTISDLGGTYVFADTDSMAIVSNEAGGLIRCPGGPEKTFDGKPAIRALSWEAVRSIVEQFESLNPYNSNVVPGSILKIERINFDPQSEKQRIIHAFAVSAKRYVLFTIDSRGNPDVSDGECKEHGLGQLLNPLDPDSEDRDWIRQFWQGFLDEEFGRSRFDPAWIHHPAVMRSSVSTPNLRGLFDRFNEGRSYSDQVKPFNFLLSAHVPSIHWPPEVSKNKGFHLIAPYSNRSAEWLGFDWTDLHSKNVYSIKFDGYSNPVAIRTQNFEDVLDRFRIHPESKSARPDGQPADGWTLGLLRRREVSVRFIIHIGKETNLLEQNEEGVLLEDPQVVYLSDADRRAILASMFQAPIRDIALATGISERMLRAIRSGERMASTRNLRKILALAG